MYFHVMVGSNDLEASKKFYDATFAALGVPSKGRFRDDEAVYNMYGDPATGLFLVTKPQDGKDACYANGGTIMFKAKSKATADAWYQAELPLAAATLVAHRGRVVCRIRSWSICATRQATRSRSSPSNDAIR
jgi:catechol 2,3-dioxygenase-like lactoylglutathione lyase family enzyme